jgi:hypothetical protein
MTETDEWKQLLERRAWAGGFAGAEGCKNGLKRQHDLMRRGLSELGLAKN